MQFSLPAAVIVLSTLIAPIASSTIPQGRSSSASPTLVVPVQPVSTYTPPTAPQEAQVTKIFSYNTGGFENLAIRSNGQILATIAFHQPLLFYIDPLSIRPTIMLHNFTTLISKIGITELKPDIFYVGGTTAPKGPFSIFSVDMRPFVALPNGTIFTPPVVKEIGSTPKAIAPNGMMSLHERDNFILIADSLLGGVWKFNVDTGSAELIIKDPSMAGDAKKTEYAAYGINGLRARNNTLFYCNSGQQTFYKMPLHPDGSSAGKATLIASGIACDDFDLDPWGFAYVASPRNPLIKLDTRTGAQLVVAGTFNSSSSDIIGGSSAHFGRGDSDRSSVYMTTNGGAYIGALPGTQGVSRVDVGDLAQALEVL